ncbi:peptide chain release factor N(5)-glutamine methyltransferase [Pandoraea nosoerga]|uniref:Release factor glutamine methyltransferase n=1 Tax=Pandoraea nosoerga TaxID=2508296 RepID=A0A5E4VVQ0_9BURK|nr:MULTISPECIES: peptide chain release factor N(5)-glutamine methyltransferase [Pandoraea]MBN4667921.1 peptide chain release factor N(5)-glutamine methyltransferase [Pandoraea nosoerga]MBN4677793.1 peptide chain release factor N(5)-glutamine methyltransferase [Pandoraea nosoerga]MBN4682904.1 peptide chain release factor N(5)-glutamine methyltransferase [Pandoraea nosoerga]MBN4746917.1 peptide chain release factor N(5)-glutamine methyltransferase [Pandoraea nosoerga]VVE15679.1 protein-(glutamin
MAHGPTGNAPASGPLTVATLLREPGLPALETRILLAHVLGWSRTQLITRDREPLAPDTVAAYRELRARRLAGEPIAYLVGTREFFGLTLSVSPAVLIPRPETELLVELALERLAARQAPRVLDLGTGSGAIALAIAHARPDAKVIALDRSDAALGVARENARRLGLTHVQWLASDWYAALPADTAPFDVIVSNPPYIVAGDEHLSRGDLRFEPVDALTDHADGLAALRTIVSGAPSRLVANGWLLCEHGYHQAADVRALCAAAGFADVVSERDLAGIERTTGGRRP